MASAQFSLYTLPLEHLLVSLCWWYTDVLFCWANNLSLRECFTAFKDLMSFTSSLAKPTLCLASTDCLRRSVIASACSSFISDLLRNLVLFWPEFEVWISHIQSLSSRVSSSKKILKKKAQWFRALISSHLDYCKSLPPHTHIPQSSSTCR